MTNIMVVRHEQRDGTCIIQEESKEKQAHLGE